MKNYCITAQELQDLGFTRDMSYPKQLVFRARGILTVTLGKKDARVATPVRGKNFTDTNSLIEAIASLTNHIRGFKF